MHQLRHLSLFEHDLASLMAYCTGPGTRSSSAKRRLYPARAVRSIPVQVWYDGPNNLRRVDSWDGTDSIATVEVSTADKKVSCSCFVRTGRPIGVPWGLC